MTIFDNKYPPPVNIDANMIDFMEYGSCEIAFVIIPP